MKKPLQLLVLLMAFAQAVAQVPQQINYQGVARNSVGSVIANQNISLRLSIRDGAVSGPVVYSETRTLKTNNFGLFVTAIGAPGAATVTGSLGSVDWGAGVKFLQVEMDPKGASQFIDMGTSQLLSVPYAMYAGAAPPTGSAGGDLQGSYPSPVIKDGAVTNSKIGEGQISASKLQAGVIPGSLPPNGMAGGDLTGSYPDPVLKAGAVDSTKIAADAINTSKIFDGSVTLAKLAPGTIPTALPPNGAAGGDLSGTYPNPVIADQAVTAQKLADGAVSDTKIADNSVGTSKIQDGAITSAKLAPGLIPTATTPTGNAGGDLTGFYPNPAIADNAVSTNKIADGSITASKLATGVLPAALPPNGSAGGDLSGTYPNPAIASAAINNSKLADNAVSTSKIQDASVTAQKLAAGVIPSALPPNGTAGGDLSGSYPNPVVSQLQGVLVSSTAPASGQVLKFNGTAWVPAADNGGGSGSPSGSAGGDLAGTYPNPTIATGVIDNTKLADNAVGTSKIQDASVTAIKLAAGVIPTALPPNGTAGGDLAGSYPNPTIATGVIDNTKLADNAVGTSKIQDASVTAIKLAAGVIPTALPPSGTAGGDLTGSYPNPTIATGVIDNTKLADNAVGTSKIQDASVTAIKLAAGVIPTALPPNGTAGGDLTGSFPNPTLDKIKGISVSNTVPASGQVLKFDGTQWIPSADNVGSGGSPTGSAGGDLSGNYPNPTIASGAVTAPKILNGAVNTPKLADGAVNTKKLGDLSVTTEKIVDGAVTAAKLAPGLIPTSLPPSGSAGGDLTGTYPNPTVADNAISTSKIADGSITAIKLSAGVLPTALPPNGTAGGDLSGSYPNPVVSQLQGVSVSSTAPASGQVLKFNGTAWVPAADDTGGSGSPSGSAGGDLAGTYPNPTIATGVIDNTKLADNAVGTSKIQDASVTAIKLAAGVIPTALPPNGTAGGDLAGSYPNPTIATGVIDNTKLADNAVSTSKIQDASVTAIKLAAGVIPTALPPTGTAGGDLTGSYPNPMVADNAITNTKIADGAVTASKLASGVLPTSLPPNGAAGGDLSGNYPAPVVSRIQGIPVSSTAPASGQILKYNGSQWVAAAESAGGSFSLPYGGTSTSSGDLFSITNNGTGTALQGINGNTGDNVTAVLGAITSTSAGNLSAGVKGINYGTGTQGVGVFGTHAGSGYGVYGSSTGGSGVYGYSPTGYGVVAESVSGRAFSSTSVSGNAGFFSVSDANNFSDAVYVSNAGYGNGMTVLSEQGYGMQVATNSAYAYGLRAFNYSGGTGLSGVTMGTTGPAVEAINTADGGTALVAALLGTTGDVAVFQSNYSNVARIDASGKGYFNGGTQNSGADLAEAFDVEGSKAAYEPGDVLIISTSSDRTVEKSQTSYSTLVAGVYATKPGVLLTEKTQQEPIDHMVPMGVIGVIPTKVCTEGGAIKRGDLLVTSSTAGVAMKGDPDKIKIGQVIGKALEDFDGNGTGKIKVLVSIK